MIKYTIITVMMAVLVLSAAAQPRERVDRPGGGADNGQTEFMLRGIFNQSHNRVTSGNLPKSTYADYAAARDAYKNSPKAQRSFLSMIARCDSFYEQGIPEYISNKVKEYKQSYLSDVAQKKEDPRSLYAKMKSRKTEMEKYVGLLPPNAAVLPELTSYKDSVVSMYDWCEKYMNGGEFTAFKDAKEKETISKREFPKAMASNPTWDQGARKAATSQIGNDIKILKSAVVTNGWRIIKNDVDIPKYRVQVVAVGFSRGGKCFYREVEVQQDYSGGGTWNNSYDYNANNAIDMELPCEKLH